MGIGNTMKNAMTIDVEDYFQVSAFEDKFDPSNWSDISPRVETNTHRLLDIFQSIMLKQRFLL